MLEKFSRLAITVVGVLLLLVACSKPGETPEVSGPVTPSAAPTTFESPLVAPTATLPALDSPLPTPTRGPSTNGKAALKGVLMLLNPEYIAPEEDGLYLVEVDTESLAGMVFPSVDPETSIRAEVDEVTGQFFFDDVGEGLYAFVALTLSGQQLSVREMDTGAASIVNVSQADLDTVIDLGMLRLP